MPVHHVRGTDLARQQADPASRDGIEGAFVDHAATEQAREPCLPGSGAPDVGDDSRTGVKGDLTRLAAALGEYRDDLGAVRGGNQLASVSQPNLSSRSWTTGYLWRSPWLWSR